MSPLHTAKSIAFASAFALISTHALAQTDAEHAQHHPDASSSQPAAKPAVPPATATNAMDNMGGRMKAVREMHENSRMKAMQDMHEKMMAAKTPEERNALMPDHMKAMQDGMAVMGKMKGTAGMGGKSKDTMGDYQMMEKRMDMMTTMMQMMMDRMPENAAK